jgi:uncharacterized protein
LLKIPIYFPVEFLDKNYQNKWVMSTKRVVISQGEQLEGVLREGKASRGAVICHPHPLYGGDMWNSVVEAMENGFCRAGFFTLKFNFRGAGVSSGAYDGGRGEALDVMAAFQFLKQSIPTGGRIVLAGYSFGAWVACRALEQIEEPVDLFLVAYPFSVYGSGKLDVFRGKACLVAGSHDEISPLQSLLTFYQGWEAEKFLKVIPTSHFFHGKEKELEGFIFERFRDPGL